MKIPYLIDASLAKISLNVTTGQQLNRAWKDYRGWLASVAIVMLLTVFDPEQALDSVVFAADALLETAPFFPDYCFNFVA